MQFYCLYIPIVYWNSLHIKQFTYDDCEADTILPSKNTRNKNNSFTFPTNSQPTTTFTTIDTKMVSDAWKQLP